MRSSNGLNLSKSSSPMRPGLFTKPSTSTDHGLTLSCCAWRAGSDLSVPNS